MACRSPAVKGLFYPEYGDECQEQVKIMLDSVPRRDDMTRPIRAALVPHAGWFYSGITAAHAYAALEKSPAQTIVLFGAIHRWGVNKAALYGRGSWMTPIDLVNIDEPLARAIVGSSRGLIVNHQAAHEREHSIEVQLPFLQGIFLQPEIVPIAVPPDENAHLVGHIVAQAAKRLGRAVIAIASSDLTHYGPNYGMTLAGTGSKAAEWVHKNDQHILDLAVGMEEEHIVDCNAFFHNACGAGAIAAAVGFALEYGATKGVILDHTTSFEARRMGSPSHMVGYASMVFS